MPFANEVVLLLVGAILSYFLKTLTDKRNQNDIRTEISSINNSITDIREILIRNEAIAADVTELKAQMKDILFHNIEQDKRIAEMKAQCHECKLRK